jgi:hypothetical protein
MPQKRYKSINKKGVAPVIRFVLARLILKQRWPPRPGGLLFIAFNPSSMGYSLAK